VAILVRAGGWPIGGGGVVLPWSAGSKRSGAGIFESEGQYSKWDAKMIVEMHLRIV
jgi:hypothetical protein